MLRCSDGSYYVGHTDALEQRLGQHQGGAFASCYTFKRRPVVMVWNDEFPTRDEAKVAERKLKGWSRAKKEALVAGDWERVGALARNRQGKPSLPALRQAQG